MARQGGWRSRRAAMGGHWLRRPGPDRHGRRSGCTGLDGGPGARGHRHAVALASDADGDAAGYGGRRIRHWDQRDRRDLVGLVCFPRFGCRVRLQFACGIWLPVDVHHRRRTCRLAPVDNQASQADGAGLPGRAHRRPKAGGAVRPPHWFARTLRRGALSRRTDAPRWGCPIWVTTVESRRNEWIRDNLDDLDAYAEYHPSFAKALGEWRTTQEKED